MRVLLAFAALLVGGCFTPDLGDGAVACGVDDACPPRYSCRAADKHCYQTAGGSGGGGDLGGADFAACMRASCGAQACGVIDDNCGGTLDCGDACVMGQSCGGGGTPHQCGCATQVSCGNHDCGTMPDGCGGVESCGGNCPPGKTCGGGNGGMKMANVCGIGQLCAPRACKAGNDCGLISDGCAAVLDCGGCQPGKSCGADHMCH